MSFNVYECTRKLIPLVVDTNILISELLRKRGRDLISSDLLDLFLAEKMRNEVEYALKKRIKIIVNKTDLTEYLG
ncbi:MAG: nucleotide-binding protein [Crocosphaera sp.]|nr:nucleotide-binding protein [Crocosphaera sp.]